MGQLCAFNTPHSSIGAKGRGGEVGRCEGVKVGRGVRELVKGGEGRRDQLS